MLRIRTAFACFYLDRNPGDVEALKELMGHRTLKTTEIYLRKLDKQTDGGDRQAQLGSHQRPVRLGQRQLLVELVARLSPAGTEVGHPLGGGIARRLGPGDVDLLGPLGNAGQHGSNASRGQAEAHPPRPVPRPPPGLVSTCRKPPCTARRARLPSPSSTLTSQGTTSPTSGVCPSSTVSAPSEVASTTDRAPPANLQGLLGRHHLESEDAVVGH